MGNSIVELVKEIAMNAIESSKPMQIVSGIVISIDPLQVYVEQKMTLSSKQLSILRSPFEETPLEAGERVALLREQGGQKYFILDRIL